MVRLIEISRAQEQSSRTRSRGRPVEVLGRSRCRGRRRCRLRGRRAGRADAAVALRRPVGDAGPGRRRGAPRGRQSLAPASTPQRRGLLAAHAKDGGRAGAGVDGAPGAAAYRARAGGAAPRHRARPARPGRISPQERVLLREPRLRRGRGEPRRRSATRLRLQARGCEGCSETGRRGCRDYTRLAGLRFDQSTPTRRGRRPAGPDLPGLIMAGCLCDAANPPCPTCTELRVPLARVRTSRAATSSTSASLERQWVLSPRALNYWFPVVEAVRELLRERCCADRPGVRRAQADGSRSASSTAAARAVAVGDGLVRSPEDTPRAARGDASARRPVRSRRARCPRRPRPALHRLPLRPPPSTRRPGPRSPRGSRSSRPRRDGPCARTFLDGAILAAGDLDLAGDAPPATATPGTPGTCTRPGVAPGSSWRCTRGAPAGRARTSTSP